MTWSKVVLICAAVLAFPLEPRAQPGPSAPLAVKQPAIVVARILGAQEVSGKPVDEGIMASVFQARVQVIWVIAGDKSLDRATLTVFLQAGNSGYLNKGNHILIGLDPAAYTAKRTLYWNTALSLQCFDPSIAKDLGVVVDQRDAFEYAGQTCVPE